MDTCQGEMTAAQAPATTACGRTRLWMTQGVSWRKIGNTTAACASTPTTLGVPWRRGKASVSAWADPCLGTQTIDGTTWQPYQPASIVTPPFPEYISGHSAFNADAVFVRAKKE